MNQDLVSKAVVLMMALGITALFFTMIQPFLMALFLAGLVSAMARPLYLRLRERFSGRRHLASFATLLVTAVLVLIPLAVLGTVLVGQALDISQELSVWIRQRVSDPTALLALLERVPFYDEVLVYREQIIKFAGDLASFLSRLLVDWVSSVTLGTVNFFFLAFVMLYSIYFLQMDGPKLIERFLYYLPLKTRDERLLLAKFTSVTRATVKGSLLIGALQGALAGIAFAVAGIENAVFWGTLMAILAIIPNLGAALVWVPAAVILVVQGQVAAGIGLALFCGIVVGSLDNVLRPILVGKDTKMHELMIFFGTLGGIFMFGLSGIFIGPLIASLFISVWELYGAEFADVLPDVDGVMEMLGEPSETPVASVASATAGGESGAATTAPGATLEGEGSGATGDTDSGASAGSSVASKG